MAVIITMVLINYYEMRTGSYAIQLENGEIAVTV